MTKPRCIILAAGIYAAAICSPSLADVVTLKNGDKINGTIGQIADGKMEFKSPVLGDIKIDLANVESYTTDEPATIKLKSKAAAEAATQPVITDRITAGDATKVETAGGQSFTLDKVKVINPPKQAWTGSVLGSAALARGNTDKFDVGFRADATLRRDRNRFTLGGHAVGTSAPIDGASTFCHVTPKSVVPYTASGLASNRPRPLACSATSTMATPGGPAALQLTPKSPLRSKERVCRTPRMVLPAALTPLSASTGALERSNAPSGPSAT